MLRLAIALLLAAPVLLSADEPNSDDLPRVLLLGDSISIGYTPYVQKMLAGEAEVVRPTRDNGKPENCAGTTNGVANVDRWLKIGGGNWDVIHVNFGLHDLKRVDPKTGGVSTNPDHPNQADLQTYEKQLTEIFQKLNQTGATLILCTTTPVPEGKVRPHRDVTAPAEYNAVAIKVAKANGATMINDLYGFANPQLKKIQRPVNVHFTPEGSQALAKQVVQTIRQALKARDKE